MKKTKFPLVVKRGSVSVKIYSTPSHGCASFTLSYYQDGVRKRPTFPDLDSARAEAEAVATRLSSTDADVLTLTSADRAAYLRARQLLEPSGVALETAAAQFAEARQQLGDIPLPQAVEFFLRRNPRNLKARMVKDMVAELLESKKGDGLSDGYLRHLGYDLKKFGEAFACHIGTITGAEIDSWLRGLKVAPRTRNNLRASVQTLFSFAKARKYLPKDHDEIEAVPVAKDNDGEIEIFTPAEMVELLALARPHLVPFLALGAFAGVRHAEIQRLHWEDIKLEAGIIEIKAAKAKTASRRTIPILPNLQCWLTPHFKTAGPVCSRSNMADEIVDLVKVINAKREQAKQNCASGSLTDKEKFAWKHNGLRHSFISYRVADIQNVAQVALEAGNSPQIIFQNYRELVMPADAKKWFAIEPKEGGNVTSMPKAGSKAA